MVISLRCKSCKERLIGDRNEYLFFCNNCKRVYLMRDQGFEEINTYIISNDKDFDILFPTCLFRCKIDYIHFATNKQKEIASKYGTNLYVIVRAFSMIDPIYFGDIEIEIMQKLNNSQIEFKEYTLNNKIFSMNIKPEICSRLARYTFMKYFDRMADITGLQYSFIIESTSILFLRGRKEGRKILLQDLQKEMPASAIIIV